MYKENINMDNIILTKTDGVCGSIELRYENIEIIKKGENFYIKDDDNYYQLQGKITFTTEDLKKVIEEFNDSKPNKKRN